MTNAGKLKHMERDDLANDKGTDMDFYTQDRGDN